MQEKENDIGILEHGTFEDSIGKKRNCWAKTWIEVLALTETKNRKESKNSKQREMV